MSNAKWHVLLIQSIILTLNIVFLIGSDRHLFFIISISITLLLFILQAFFGNLYFLYSLPDNFAKSDNYISWEIWFLRVSIVLSILFLYLGATESLFHQI